MGYAQEERMRTIRKVKNMFIEAYRKGGGLYKPKALAVICENTGATTRKAQEYLKDLLLFGFIEYADIDAELLVLKDKSSIEEVPNEI